MKKTHQEPTLRDRLNAFRTHSIRNGKYSSEVEKANGQLEKTGSYKFGKQIGEWKYYDEQGNLIKTEKY